MKNAHMPQPDRPESYLRRVLVAVTGMSPQVVTETLYALAVRPVRAPHADRPAAEPFVPTEIYLITTARGAEHARLNLLSQEPGWFHRLRRDYGLPEIAFDPSRIHAIPGDGGGPLEDIRSKEDNERAADFITEQVRALTADPESALHVSIAGGRKTMGYYLGYALSLYGRPQDRLSHVLVSAPYESHPQFYYPTRKEYVIHTLDNQRLALDCRKAEVTLADIPFVRLRDGLPEALLSGASRFSDSVSAAQRAFGPLSLVIELSDDGAMIQAGGVVVDIAPADAAFYLMMARAAAEGRTLRWDDPGVGDAYLREYARFSDPMSPRYLDAKRRLEDELLDDWFEERKSKCNAALGDSLGKAGARAYGIQGFGGKGRMRFGLALSSDVIHVLDALPAGATTLPLRQRPEHSK